jgi:hypothetical protein
MRKNCEFCQTSSQESNITPTPNLFMADSVTGDLWTLLLLTNPERMTQIWSTTLVKQEYFLMVQQRVDLKLLSTEKVE